ncbi:MAG: hypothetical protein A2564_01165 [Candidatus Wildermuthbacteria bacterium RIFOXYD1_FULL_50_12]|nr:MAG: hypothetical protein UY38_C0002G0311 [Parcubacteria group bacterium GW2011_GWB1_49_12]OHA78220.1 MAG: hypothetical protein A2564_01165 [Candidatus Wildermuthbacteria bacterium RIFOXYD1_FULL_50_12]
MRRAPVPYRGTAGPVSPLLRSPPCQGSMGAAIGLAFILIVVGIFLPNVLDAMEEFLLTLLAKATSFLDALQVPTN